MQNNSLNLYLANIGGLLIVICVFYFLRPKRVASDGFFSQIKWNVESAAICIIVIYTVHICFYYIAGFKKSGIAEVSLGLMPTLVWL